MRVTAWITIVLLLSSCYVARYGVNEPLDATSIARLRPGETTAAQALNILGAPARIVELGDRSAYYYEAQTGKAMAFSLVVLTLANDDMRTDRLWLFFDQNDKLLHYGKTLSSHRTQYAMPWSNVHRAEDHHADDATRFGSARR